MGAAASLGNGYGITAGEKIAVDDGYRLFRAESFIFTTN